MTDWQSDDGLMSIDPVPTGFVLTLWIDRNVGEEYGSKSVFGDDGTVFPTMDEAKATASRIHARVAEARSNHDR